MRPVSRLEALIPIAMAASLLLPGLGALLGFVVLAVLWLMSRRWRGKASWRILWLGLVVTCLVVEALTLVVGSKPSHFHDQVAERYDEMWQQLDGAAERTVESLTPYPLSAADPLPVFEILSSEADSNSPPGSTILLLDDRGTVMAWGGKGLLHEIEGMSALAAGRHYQASFSAVTLVAVQRLEVAGRTWHVAAGSSLRTETFPFADVPTRSPGWTLVPAGAEIAEGVLRVTSSSGPDLVVEEPTFSRPPQQVLVPTGWRRAAIALWGLGMLWLAGGWGWSAPVPRPGVFIGLSVGLFLLGLAAHAPAWTAVVLAVAGGLAYWSRFNTRLGTSLLGVVAMGVAAAISVPALALLVLRSAEIPDLGSELWSNPGDLASRIALALLVWGAVMAVPRSSGGEDGRSSVVLGFSLLALLASAAFVDQTLFAIVLLLVSGVAIAIWKRRGGLEESAAPLVVLGIVAALLAATGWEIAFRWNQREMIRETLLPAMAPPTASEIESLADEMETFLGSWDIEDLVPAALEEHSRQDLAFEIWRHSPLSEYGGLSALRVLPHGGGLSSFSFGLPLNKERWVDWSSPLLGTVSEPAWQDAVLVGDGALSLGGESWAYAEWALALQPGFRFRERYQGDLADVLLRAGPEAGEAALKDLSGALYGLFGTNGQPIVTPWPRPPKLSEEILVGGEGVVDTPDGRSMAFGVVGSDGVRVLFLLDLSLAAALERVGSHALPSVLILGALMLAMRLPQWARAGFGASWYHLWHSYSRRLVLVYSVLLLVPLGIVNFLVVRAFEERLHREQEAAGLLAVESAQGVLGEHVLALEPGFGIDAALDDELLHWLSGVVHHDVNLYWRGVVYASSKAEIFTAGLLPRRIPGEIYSGLTLLGHEVSMRTNQAGRSEYLELYAPLTVPGISFGRTRLIVSLPLLAQQAETAEQIASLRRRALLGTAVVVLVIMALGARLARRFTAPLMDIVEGTQRIAAGDASLELRPVELELTTLVDAIDDMAARIHAARQDLLREKRVVDRMVENITAGVVSLDERGRVLMVNRVAGEMVGVEVGQDLDMVIDESERLAPLAHFVSSVPEGELTQRTVMLKDAEGEEQEWALVWVPLPGTGEPSALLVLEDVTEVLQGQRLQAWAEMARMIAHEIKNPLTPIRLSAEHMQEVYQSDPEGFSEVFESCTANILTQVGELQEIASEFSTYSRIPTIEPRQGNLVEVVEKIVGAYRPVSSKDVAVELFTRRQVVEATFDAKLVGRAVRNILENAVRAAPRGGKVEVTVEKNDGEARIVVGDNGPGVEESLLARIFDPYFSTHDAGTGLGLPIAKRIAEEHGGEIAARNRDSGGLEVTVTLPAG